MRRLRTDRYCFTSVCDGIWVIPTHKGVISSKRAVKPDVSAALDDLWEAQQFMSKIQGSLDGKLVHIPKFGWVERTEAAPDATLKVDVVDKGHIEELKAKIAELDKKILLKERANDHLTYEIAGLAGRIQAYENVVEKIFQVEP